MSEENRDMLLTAIARARIWVKDLAEAHVASFAEIAEREGKAERHIRFLTQLAFVSPRIVSAVIAGGTRNLKLVDLAKVTGASWAMQQERLENF
jgi:site-specific DNA recombinase